MLIDETTLHHANAAPRVGQARLHSIYEAIGGTAIGFVISYAIQHLLIAPVFNLRTDPFEDFLIVTIFTVASVLRSYFVRRFFNWLHVRSAKRAHQ